MTSLRDEGINTKGMFTSHNLIKISVGGQGVTQLLLLILPKLQGLKLESLLIEIMIVRIGLRGE
ncbi:hypothetical protein CMK19_21135 [Candidatus Poribacteria bacterium]|nr:hypothetical protein [Candidatus Poribacteria bacterium]